MRTTLRAPRRRHRAEPAATLTRGPERSFVYTAAPGRTNKAKVDATIDGGPGKDALSGGPGRNVVHQD
ncbi:hypothetical protein [Streptomyces geranii]|uniref:hypothetical protein n=1 Tax=Streptomyces geranii TaxID=2058923 RepID=UPI001300A558|nr:hypothetical protein [Streptomyces geranii]